MSNFRISTDKFFSEKYNENKIENGISLKLLKLQGFSFEFFLGLHEK